MANFGRLNDSLPLTDRELRDTLREDSITHADRLRELYRRVAALEGVSQVDDFLGLDDTPSSFSGQGNKVVSVNSGATALEFTTASGSSPTEVAWTSYTPVWTTTLGTITQGNATLEGAYYRLGNMCLVSVYLQWGSTTSVSGDAAGSWRLSLPINYIGTQMTSSGVVLSGYSRVVGRNNGVSGYMTSGTPDKLHLQSNHNETNNALNSSTPSTWSSGARIWLSGCYPVAA